MTQAQDDYPRYFAEKLWEWLPAIYRELDGLEGGDALRAFIESLADQAALLKRSQDRLWDDAYIELASDFAVPYIGQLLGTRLVSAHNPRGRRADVAKTIYYRRRKGTLAVLEQLIADLAEWEGKVVEEMRRLARLRHGLDGPARAGRRTRTPEGGLADLRSARSAELAGGPFDEFHYTPDMRKPGGSLGRRGIAKLSFYVFRLQAVELRGVQPRAMKALAGNHQGYTFDPSGRDLPLFSPRRPGRDWSVWRSAAEWDLPRAISCRLLGEAVYQIGAEEIAWLLDTGPGGAPIPLPAQRSAAAHDLGLLAGQRFANAAELNRVLAGLPAAATLTQPGVWAGLLARSLVEDCGSAALLPGDNGETSVGKPALGLFFQGAGKPALLPRQRSGAGNLEQWTAKPPPGIDWLIQPERGRFLIDPGAQSLAALRVNYHVGVLGPVGAGAFGREALGGPATVQWQGGDASAGTPASGVAEVQDSATYTSPPGQTGLGNCLIRAAEAQRPYLRLTADWTLSANIGNATLALDGLWLGSLGPVCSLVLGKTGSGDDYEQVSLRFCTLDPGGQDANGANLPPVALVVTGFVEELLIEHCILSRIVLQGPQAGINRLVIRDSILDGRLAASPPINVPTAQLDIRRSTVVAADLSQDAILVERIDASDTLVAGVVRASDAQNGCFRFSALAAGSSAPHPYHSQILAELAGLFASRRFGDPHYLQLSPAAPEAIARGAEDGREMGAYCQALVPIKHDSLLAKIDEFMPFGRLPNLIYDN